MIARLDTEWLMHYSKISHNPRVIFSAIEKLFMP